MELSGSITEKLTNESTKVKIREKLSLNLEKVQKTFFYGIRPWYHGTIALRCVPRVVILHFCFLVFALFLKIQRLIFGTTGKCPTRPRFPMSVEGNRRQTPQGGHRLRTVGCLRNAAPRSCQFAFQGRNHSGRRCSGSQMGACGRRHCPKGSFYSGIAPEKSIIVCQGF